VLFSTPFFLLDRVDLVVAKRIVDHLLLALNKQPQASIAGRNNNLAVIPAKA
jgi:hypothetical protein